MSATTRSPAAAATTTINGGDGNDTLDGELATTRSTATAATISSTAARATTRSAGGDGNDTYVVDSGGDIVDETAPGSDGIDTVQSSVDLHRA